ncbi:MAG: hypothetical protein HC850_13325 [Rhodomicrobium sp.]|nr:hypothetical protein [Rhodomicrobium sp.]
MSSAVRRRIAEIIAARKSLARNSGKNKFNTHAERDGFLNPFVHDYNHTRLKCLVYKAPLQAIANLTGPYI